MQNKIIAILLVLTGALVAGAIYMMYREPTPYVEQDVDMSTTTKDSGITLVSSSTLGHTEASSTQDTETNIEETAKVDPSIYTGSEVPGTRFYIDYANLSADGFIVIYENGAEPMGEVLGTSVYLPRGEYTNVPILLSRAVKHGEVFDAVLHTDNGDRTFNILTDGLFKQDNGFGVITHISVLNVPAS